MEEELDAKRDEDFMTPEEAGEKLRSLGYRDFNLIPKQAHYLQALYIISQSKTGYRFSDVYDALHSLDPKHQKQPDKVKVDKFITDYKVPKRKY